MLELTASAGSRSRQDRRLRAAARRRVPHAGELGQMPPRDARARPGREALTPLDDARILRVRRRVYATHRRPAPRGARRGARVRGGRALSRARADAGRRSRSSGSARCPRRRASRSRRASSSRTFSPRRAAARTSSGRCCARPRRRSSGSTTSAPPASPISAARISSGAGASAYLEIRNDRHLNAEDCETLPTTETAVDLALLDPEVEVGVIRGAVVSHPRYAGRRVFGAGLNLTHLYHGRLDFLFFVTRDLGYVNKLFRGLSSRRASPGRARADDGEALGRGRRDVRDRRRLPDPPHRRPRDRDARRAALPARAQGGHPPGRIQPAPRALGRRQARAAGNPLGARVRGRARRTATCSATRSSSRAAELDAAIARRVDALTSSGLVNAAGNRRALRVGAEPLDLFRSYMATFCREQAVLPLQPCARAEPRAALERT